MPRRHSSALPKNKQEDRNSPILLLSCGNDQKPLTYGRLFAILLT